MRLLRRPSRLRARTAAQTPQKQPKPRKEAPQCTPALLACSVADLHPEFAHSEPYHFVDHPRPLPVCDTRVDARRPRVVEAQLLDENARLCRTEILISKDAQSAVAELRKALAEHKAIQKQEEEEETKRLRKRSVSHVPPVVRQLDMNDAESSGSSERSQTMCAARSARTLTAAVNVPARRAVARVGRTLASPVQMVSHCPGDAVRPRPRYADGSCADGTVTYVETEDFNETSSQSSTQVSSAPVCAYDMAIESPAESDLSIPDVPPASSQREQSGLSSSGELDLLATRMAEAINLRQAHVPPLKSKSRISICFRGGNNLQRADSNVREPRLSRRFSVPERYFAQHRARKHAPIPNSPYVDSTSSDRFAQSGVPSRDRNVRVSLDLGKLPILGKSRRTRRNAEYANIRRSGSLYGLKI